MPMKNNVLLRYQARKSLQGQWQTALLVMLVTSLVSWAAQIVSSFQGYGLQQQLLLALQTMTPEQLESPDFLWKILQTQLSHDRLASNLTYLAAMLVTPVLSLGATNYFLKLLRGDRDQSWTAVFSRLSSVLKAWGVSLLMALKTLAWMLPGLALLIVVVVITSAAPTVSRYGASWLVTLIIVSYAGMIIPAVLAMLRYALSTFFLADHPDWSCRRCIRASKESMAHQKLNLFLMGISFLGWMILINLFSELIYTMMGQVVYLVVYLGLMLVLNAYIQCSKCAFYEAWRMDAPPADPLKEAGENGTVE